MTLREALIAAVAEILHQGLALLDALDDETYVKRSSGPFDASVGEHYRHVLEHFVTLADALPSRVIDYDARRRDRQMDCRREYAASQTSATIRRFQHLSDEDIDAACEVLYEVGYGQIRQLGMTSTVAREIVFAVSHAVHHFALIRVTCAEFGLELSPSFGVAPSTLAYRQASHAA
jgi:hypothetical protein